MISYHPSKPTYNAALYRDGFKAVDTLHLQRIANCMANYVWSPCVWKYGLRRSSDFDCADLAVLDFDDGEMTVEDAKRAFCDMQHVIGLTRNHQKVKHPGEKAEQPACDRFRVVIPFERRIEDANEFTENMRAIMAKYPIDTSCKDAARYYFPCTEIISVALEGFMQEVIWVATPDIMKSIERKEVMRQQMVSPQWAVNMLTIEHPPGTRSTMFYRIAKDLYAVGYSQEKLLKMFIDSPTFKGQVSKHDVWKLNDAIRSAVKKVAIEREKLLRQAQ